MQKLINKIKQEPTVYMFLKMWRFSKGNRPNVVLFVFMYMLSNGITLVTPLIFAWFINEIQANGVTQTNVWKLSAIISLSMLTTLIFWVAHGYGRVLEQKNAVLLGINYRKYFIAGTLGLSMQWHNDRDSGDTIDKINKATLGLFMFSDQLFEIFKIVFGIVGAIFVLYFFNIYIAVAVFILIGLALYVLSRFDKILVKYYRKLNKFENKIAAGIFDTISNVTSILILNIQSAVLKRLYSLLVAPVETSVQYAKTTSLKWFSGSVMFRFIVVASVVFYLFYQLGNGSVIAIGTITALYMYLEQMSESFFAFSYMYESVMYRKAGVENAKEIELAIEENVTKPKKHVINEWKTLDIQDLNFSYNDIVKSNLNHLNNISLMVTRGERIACIGESGSGKTTFLKVLHGLYGSASANVSFDNGKKITTNFADIDLKTLMVPQEPEVFSSTIQENITLGLDYSKGEVGNVVDIAQLTSVIEQLPKGLKSVINEKGVNLSGGQKQRIALARALLFAQDKDIILLDESTSSVDSDNEQKIYKQIFDKFKNKTIIASIHKMNLLKYFDRIIIFANGRVTDIGTFQELLERNDKFEKNWDEFVQISK